MNSRTKIIVLHLKELIYTGVFLILGVLFIILLAIMFLPSKQTKETKTASTAMYTPGIYTTTIPLGEASVDVEVVVDEEQINSLRLNAPDEAVKTMYPLIEPTFEELSRQITQKQSLEEITYSDDSRYTSLMLLDAISQSLENASGNARQKTSDQ